jgi:hypothetical protein
VAAYAAHFSKEQKARKLNTPNMGVFSGCAVATPRLRLPPDGNEESAIEHYAHNTKSSPQIPEGAIGPPRIRRHAQGQDAFRLARSTGDDLYSRCQTKKIAFVTFK